MTLPIVLFTGSLFLLTIFMLTGLLYAYFDRHSHSVESNSSVMDLPPAKAIEAESSFELLEHLKKHDLWDIPQGAEISPVLLASYPGNLNMLEVNEKKKAFFHSLLPVSMIALQEVEHERDALLQLIKKGGNDIKNVDFIPSTVFWTSLFTPVEIDFLTYLTEKYRTKTISGLLDRVNVVPVSLVLAQGAIESSWGSSRFAQEGNNLFGMWTWGEKGIVPAGREEGQKHKIAVYPTILDSVRAYLLVLNRHNAYSNFRIIRRSTLDSAALAEGLLKYSQRRYEYVRDVKRVIKSNRLDRFDLHTLAPSALLETGRINLTRLVLENHVSF
ncbi:glucosaminidase domain-containing protein [Thermodesulfobacteriota bacterium]